MNLYVSDGARVSLTAEQDETYAGLDLSVGGELLVGQDAELTVNSNGNSIRSRDDYSIVNAGKMNLTAHERQAIRLGVRSSMELQEGSSFKAYAGAIDLAAIEASGGSITVSPEAAFEVEANGRLGAVITGNTLEFQNGSNFSITNYNPEGPVFDGELSTQIILSSDIGVDTWTRGAESSVDEPTGVYRGVFEATVEINGTDNLLEQTSIESNNEQFLQNFQAGEVGKITGGSFVTLK